MLVVSKEVINEKEFKAGTVLVSCLKDDIELVREKILNKMDENGIEYVIVEKTPGNCSEFYFYENVRKKIDQSICGIYVFSPKYNNEEYSACRQALFYEIGIMESLGKRVFPFLLNDDTDEMRYFLNDKPIAQIQGTNDFTSLLGTFKELNVAGRPYFSDYILNKYVTKHVKYVKFTVIMNIYTDSLRRVFESDSWDKNEAEWNQKSMKEMLDILFEDLKTGATIIRFGKDEILRHPAYAPYIQESQCIFFDCPAQYDKTGKVKIVEQNEKENSIATTIRMELSMPVHEVLGASFKPFLSLSIRSRWKSAHLLELLHFDDDMSKSCNKNSFKSIRMGTENRVYFLIPLDKDKCTIDPGEELNTKYGDSCNYIFPK